MLHLICVLPKTSRSQCESLMEDDGAVSVVSAHSAHCRFLSTGFCDNDQLSSEPVFPGRDA